MASHDDSAPRTRRSVRVVLRRRWTIVVVATVVVVGVAGIVSWSQTARYRAEAVVVVRALPPAVEVELEGSSSGWVASEVHRAESVDVVRAVRTEFGSEPDLDVRVDDGTDALVFAAVSRDAAVAAAAANGHAQSYIDERREELVAEYVAVVEILRARQAELSTDGDAASEAQDLRYTEQIDEFLIAAELAETTGSQLVDPASVPSEPVEPTTGQNLLVALPVGLLLGLGAAVVLDRVDTAIGGIDDLDAVARGASHLAAIPADPGRPADDGSVLVMRDRPQSERAEAYRALRASIQLAAVEKPIRIVGVAGARAQAGATTTAANLAIACATSGQRVVLVDADLRAPRVHHLFDLDNGTGLSSVLLGEASMVTAAHRVESEPGLVVITAGPVPSDPSALLAGKRTASLVASIAEQADLVVIDLPPVLASTDSLAIGSLCDLVVVVVALDRTEQADAASAIERLGRIDALLLGTVLSRR